MDSDRISPFTKFGKVGGVQHVLVLFPDDKWYGGEVEARQCKAVVTPDTDAFYIRLAVSSYQSRKLEAFSAGLKPRCVPVVFRFLTFVVSFTAR